MLIRKKMPQALGICYTRVSRKLMGKLKD